uniref:Uncharacterized protein n=1 Tax=Tetradesmus obliquus TaxID=3088 RepID=A0A383VHQ3_TETOB|eukprot:jgi/Sobl393_1/5082/SZX75930.1
MSRSYFISKESLYIHPACLCVAEDATLTVHSLKLQLCPATAQALVVLALDSAVVFEAAINSTRDPLKIAIPPQVLGSTGVLTVYVVLCDAAGPISDIVDSGKVLVLSRHAAAEVTALFARIRQDVQQCLPSAGITQPAPVQQQEQQQQPEQPQRSESAILSKLQHTWRFLLGKPSSNGRSRAGNAQAAAPAQPAAASAQTSSSSAGIPDAAALHAYEHFLVPFVRHWEALLLHGVAAHQVDSCSSAAAATATADALAARLLHFMLDNELWSSAVLLLDQVPAVASYALQAGLQPPACGPAILGHISGAQRPAQQQQQQQQLALGQLQPWAAAARGQQLLAAQGGRLFAVNGSPPLPPPEEEQQGGPPLPQQPGLHAGLTASSLQALHAQQQQQQQQAGYSVLSYTHELSPFGSVELPLPSHDESSFESASEILRRVLLLQQLRSEQEALAEFEEQEDASAAPPAAAPPAEQQHSSRGSGRSSGRSSLQLVLLQAQYAAAGPAVEQRFSNIHSRMAAAESALEEAAAEMTTLEVAAAVAAEAEAEEQEILAQMLYAEGLEGSYAVAGLCAGQEAALAAAEGPAMVPKLRPPKPERTYLEGSLPRLSFKKQTGRAAEAADAAAAACSGSSNPSGNVQHPAVEQQHGGDWPGAAPVAARAVPGAAGGVAPATVPVQGALLDSKEQQQPQQQCRHPVRDMVWHESKATLPAAVCKGSSAYADTISYQVASCANTTSYTVDSAVDSAAYDATEYEALAEFEAGCCSAADACEAAAIAPAAASAAAAAVAADYGQHIHHKPRQQQQQQLQQLQQDQRRPLSQQLLAHLQLAVVGYEDPCLERSYLVFKNHSSALLDTTALLICGGMLAAAAMRSVDFKADPEALGKLGVVLLYGLLFFMPYAVMQLRRQLFLRYREVLLVLARILTASVLILVAVKAVPQPGAWVSVVGNTLAMQLQNGVILPSCQQLRLPAAAAIAAAHLPSDALLLALAMPVRSAVLTSVLMQLCMLLVTVAQDAWCRHRFTQRYLGVAAGVGPARAAARQAPGAAAVDEQAQTVGPAVYAGGGEAGCSNADAVLRQRRPVQQAQ